MSTYYRETPNEPDEELRVDPKLVHEELCQMPMPAALAECEQWGFETIHRAIHRHAFYDHDCQTTFCPAMFLWNSAEMTALLADAYERGQRDALAATSEETQP